VCILDGWLPLGIGLSLCHISISFVFVACIKRTSCWLVCIDSQMAFRLLPLAILAWVG
jgi:hypothetical protein